jgi:RsmE family RNA methyltransferase
LIEDVLDTRVAEGLRLVAHPEAGTTIPSVIQHARPERVLLAIGPEGGWNAFELDLLAAHGFHAATIGPRTLRVDTACTALLAIVHGALAS